MAIYFKLLEYQLYNFINHFNIQPQISKLKFFLVDLI